MEPAYWEMRRLAQHVGSTSAESEFARLEELPPPTERPFVEHDPDTPLFPEGAGTPLLSPECGRVVAEGRWRVLRPAGSV